MSKVEIKIQSSVEGAEDLKKLEKQLSTLGDVDTFKKLKKDTQEIKASWVSAQSEVRRLAKELKSAETPTKALSKQFETAKREALALKTQFNANQQSLQALRSSLSASGVSTKKLSSEQKKLLATSKALEIEQKKLAKIKAAAGLLDVKPYKEVRKEIAALKDAYKTLKTSGTLSLRELSTAKKNMKSQISGLKRETLLWSSALSKAAVAIGVMAAGYAAVKSFSGFSEFSQRMAEVNTLLDVFQEKFNVLSDDITFMSTRIPQTASELAAAEYDIISAGVALEKSTSVLELSAKAAVAGVTDTKTAVNAGVGVINAYGKNIDELSEVYDILFKTVKSGVTTFPELAQHLGDVLPVAKSAKVTLQDVAAAIATMTKAGIRTPLAATALKGAITAMAAPAPEAKQKFDELGITWKGLLPTLDEIRKKGLSIDQMRMLIPDVEARTGVLSLSQNMEGLKETMSEISGSSGAMQEAYNKMKDTPENQIKLFKNEISKLNREVGGLVSKALLPAAGKIRHFLGSFDTGSITKMKEAANETMKQFEEFKDVKLPSDMTSLAQTDLDSFEQKLKNAKSFFEALRSKLQVDAGQTTWFGTVTKEAVESQVILKNVDKRINEIDDDLKKIKTSGEDAGEGMQKPVEAVKATSEQLDEFEKQAKKAYEYAKDQAKKYAEDVIAWEDKIKYARLSTEDKIRELGRKGLSDEKQWNDEKLQADEKLYAAREALQKGDYDLAEKLAKDAESLYAGLAEEVKKTDSSGNEIVSKSLEDTKKVAINGVESVGKFTADLYAKQKQNAEDSKAKWEETANTIQTKLDEIARDRFTNVTIELKGLEAAQSTINALTAPAKKYITVITKNVTAEHDGGTILKASRGRFIRRPHGRFPGESTVDSVPVLARPGEWFINNEAGKYWDSIKAGFMHGINNPMSAIGQRIKDAVISKKMNVGGMISKKLYSPPLPSFSTGGRVTGGGTVETLVVRFQAGDFEAPVKITDPSSRAAMKKMATELSRMRLVYGK